MILHILKNESHLDKNNISSSEQKGRISEAGLDPNIWPQCVAGLNFWYKSLCHLGISYQKY